MGEKENKLISIIEHCPEIMETLNACEKYGLKDFFLAGGAITQILWNNLLKKPQLENIKDFDIIYFSKEEAFDHEKIHENHIRKLVHHKIQLDIVNQANVHRWYGKKFGNEIAPLTRTEDGIKTWLPAFAIGISKKDSLRVYAPYGLEDAFSMTVRPNKIAMSEENYNTMTKSFKRRWNEIQIIPWLEEN